MLPSVVEHLKEYFPDKAGNILWPIVQNELAKKSFEYKPFVSSILDSGFNSESWRLGSLARICLIKQEELLPDLRVDAQNLLLAQLSRTPLDSYSSFDLLSDPVKFAITGAWAEELVGIVNDAGWEEFRQLLGIGTSSFVHDRLPFFRSSLIYMSHLLIDPWELVQMLGGHFEDREVLQMCGFIYCSYYFENEILVQQLMKFLTKISLAARLIVLRYLFQHDKKEVVSFLSEQLLAHDDDFTSSQTEINHSLDEIYAIANGYYHLSLLQFAGKKEEGERVWNELENAQNAWKAGVFLQKAQVLENWDGIIDFQNSLENLRKNDFDTQPLMEELWSLSGHREFPVSVQAAQHSPFALIQKYQDAFNNKKDDETDALAEQIVSDLKSHLSDNVAERDPKYLLKMDYDNIVEKFLQVNDLEHAEQAAVILLDKFPSDAKLMRYLAEIKEKQGSIQEALDYKILESAFLPADPTLVKRLSEYYYKCGDIGNAYRQFKKLFETDDSLSNEDHLKLAEMAYEDGDYSFVDQAAAPLLDIADSKGSALMILGKTRMVQGYYDEAVSFFRQAVEDNPYAPDRWVHLCDACRKDTEERDILGILNEGLSYLADSSTIHSEIAQEYYLNGKVTDALSYLQKAVSLPPDSKEGVINAGSLMVSMGDVQKAFEYYLNVLNRFEFDRDIARLAALSAMDNEEYETAEKILTTLFGQIKPTADDIASFILARLKGKSPIFSDDLDISTEELSKLNEKMDEGLKLDPEHLGINLLRAEMEAYLGDYESAQQIFRMLIEHDNTSHWKTLGGYGYTSLKLDDIPTAIAALQESYSINPEQTKLEQYLAEAYLEAGLLVDARSFADKLFSRKSNDPTTLLWYADLNGKMGDWEKVVAALQNAYHLNPGDPVIMMKLAESFVRTGRKQDANQLARLLINLPDLNADMLLGLANLFAQMGEWATVCDLLEKSLERGYPEPYQIHFAMSLMYQKMGDYETALNYSQKAMVSSDNYYLYIHQADLFYLLDKPQAALSCLDFSDTILPAADQSIFHHRLFNNLESIFHINNWLAAIHDGDGILFRRILSLRKLNKFEDAFRLAKDAYAAGKSENRIVILMDLAIRTANFGYVKTLVKENRHIDNKEIRQAIGLLNLRLNILLDNIDIVRKLVAEDQLARFSNSEWYCAQSIISRLDKKWDTANQNYRQAKTICLNKSALQASSNAVGMSGYDFISELLDDDPYWLWDTAAGLLIWDESIPELTRIAQEKPDHLAIQLELIKILTLAGEWTYLAAELEIEKRKPSLDRDAGEVRQLVQTSIKKFEKGIKEPNISKWVTRANIVYSKKQADIKEIGEQLQMPEDLEFLVGFLRKENKYTPAAEIAEKLGRHFKSIWQQALCYKHSNREKGIQLLKSDMDQSTGFPFQYIALGQLSEMSEDYPTAYQAYRQAVNIWKDEPLWHTHCADLAEKCGDGERSVLHLKKALNLGYKKLDTAMKLGKIYQNRSEFQKAIDTLEPVYQEGLGNFPLLMQLGFACYETGDTKKAFEYAEQAKTLDPASEQPFLLYARISDYMGQYHAAMEYTRKALELKPGDEDTLVLLSKYIEKSGNPDEAYQLLENVVVAGDAGWTVIGEYVRRKYERSGPSGVLSFLENLKNKGNLPEDMHAYLAEAYFEKEQLADAEHEALAAIKVDANSHKMNYLLAIINHRNGQLDLASHYAAQAIQLCPDRIDAYLELADIYKAKNETAKALEVYKQAINSNPGNHLGYFQAGLLLRETRDFQESEIMLKQAAKLVPDDINIHRQLGAVIALNLVHHAQEEKIVP